MFLPGALATTAAIVTISAGVVGLVAFTYRAVRRLESAVGVDKHGRTLSDRMERVEHQLWPNGGSSLADAVHRTSEGVIEAKAEARLTRDLLVKLIGDQG